jgi:hypothetical protein
VTNICTFIITQRYIEEEIPPPYPQSDARNECKKANDVLFSSFFQALNGELKKVSDFFEEAEETFFIREQRVRNGMIEASKAKFTSYNASSKAAISVVWLYKDLLSLETFAMMTYCCFSKLLKKLDKKTGLQLGLDFMNDVVNKANFTHYPRTSNMIHKTHTLFEEVQHNLSEEERCMLQTDEFLFINAVARLKNDKVLALSHSSTTLIKFDACRQHTPNKSSEVSATPLSLRSKVNVWERETTEENSNIQETATEYVTHASLTAIRIQF